MGQTFITKIHIAKQNATGITIPPEVIEALGGGKRPKVKVTIHGYTYRSTVAVYADEFLLPLSAEHRQASGLKGGDEVSVTLDLDLEPRTVEIPEDLGAALDAVPGARAAFDAVAFSKRKEFVRQVEDAKTAETRARRIAGVVDKLSPQ